MYFSNDQNGDYRWWPWEIFGRANGVTVYNKSDPKFKSNANSLEEAASIMGRDGEQFLIWRERAETLGISSIKKTEEGGAIAIRLLPGAHGLYYVPRQTEVATRAYLLSLGPTGDKESKLGLMKQLSERWFYFADFAPGQR